MRTKLIESNKPEKYVHSVRNADTSTLALTIPTGAPLVLNLSATPQPPTYTNSLPAGWEDGLQVVLPSTAGAANSPVYFYGIAVAPIVFPALGECLVHGVGQALVVRATRSATTVSWASGASSSIAGFSLTVDTVNNAFGPGAGAGAKTDVLVLDNFATMAGSATNTADTRLAASILARVFIRGM